MRASGSVLAGYCAGPQIVAGHLSHLFCDAKDTGCGIAKQPPQCKKLKGGGFNLPAEPVRNLHGTLYYEIVMRQGHLTT